MGINGLSMHPYSSKLAWELACNCLLEPCLALTDLLVAM
ncbi:hypothetical protein COLO4_03368 [Corchorus olitorius]|uniref:Uncharacterized protein n=1 Tax=Corchorus olitorius TaxID=93759 RepID=A0A1R3KYZ7_9ROSI|nr:hypothetical protein COLO4_03368 [Corchorus olitorius]